MKHVFLNVAVLAITGSSASAADFNRTAITGQRTQMIVYKSWKTKDCSGNVGVVKVVEKPLNGTLTSSQIDAVITGSRFSPDKKTPCAGKAIPGFRVEYQSTEGFKGNDRFKVQVVFGKRKPEIDNFSVNVR